MWTDSHAHLYDLDESALTAVVQACSQAGVARIINTGTSLVSSEKDLAQCAKHPSLSGAAVGISPFEASALPGAWDERLDRLLRDSRVVAVGEIGIDVTHSAYPDISLQLPLFERQLDIALTKNLPVVLHSRGCESRAADLCIRHGVRKAVFHCFTGDIPALKTILDAGYYVSFSGIITFKNSPLTECVEYAPLDRMLIETDSPYLAPVPHRGEINRPDWVVYVGERVAEIKKTDKEKAAGIIANNMREAFGGG